MGDCNNGTKKQTGGALVHLNVSVVWLGYDCQLSLVTQKKFDKVQKKFTFQGFLHVSGTGPTALWCTGSIHRFLMVDKSYCGHPIDTNIPNVRKTNQPTLCTEQQQRFQRQQDD
jgi:hypothetical protein